MGDNEGRQGARRAPRGFDVYVNRILEDVTEYFGVVVLEMATARKAVEDDGTVVVDWVWSMWENGKLIEAADPRLLGKFDMVEMERMLMTGLASVHRNLVKRPTVMNSVLLWCSAKS